MRGRGLCALVFLAVLASAAPAHAATVSLTAVGLTYTAGPGETNDLTIEQTSCASTGCAQDYIDISDPGAVITESQDDCLTPDVHHVRCYGGTTDWAFATLTIQLNDKADTVEAASGARAATVNGGDGADTLKSIGTPAGYSGGGGDDEIWAIQDDTVDGGDGDDFIHGPTAFCPAGWVGQAGGWGEHPAKVDGGGGTDVLSFDGQYAWCGNGTPYNEGPGLELNFNDSAFTDLEGFEGSTADDVLTGNSKDNYLDGGDGKDTVKGKGGDDELRGGSGVAYGDVLKGGDGNDKLTATNDGSTVMDGGDGNDTLTGDENTDKLTGGNGNDIVSGKAGNDFVIAGAGRDTYTGGDDTDEISYADYTKPVTVRQLGSAKDGTRHELDSTNGFEHVIGGSGSDLLWGESSDDTLEGGQGDDKLNGRGGADTLDGGGGVDRLQGDDGTDTLLGGMASDSLGGGGGADMLLGGVGADDLKGGDGTDTVNYYEDDHDDGVTVTFDNVANDGNGADAVVPLALQSGIGEVPDQPNNPQQQNRDNVRRTVEIVIGTNGDDVLEGSAGDNTLTGLEGKDTLAGFAGNDTLNGGLDADKIFGGDGDDAISGEYGNDLISGGPGLDAILCGEGKDRVTDSEDAERANGQQSDCELFGPRGGAQA